MTDAPRLIKIKDADNVAVVADAPGLPADTVCADGLRLRQGVPQGHKVALSDLDEGDPVVRYGETLGYATQPLRRGAWVTERLVRLPAPPELHALPLATAVPDPLPPLEGYTFEGFRNADGSVGTKNVLGISMSVQCVAGVLDHAVARIKTDLLPRFPNVDDVVALEHVYGCGVAIDAPDAIIPIRTVQNLARNPNLGGEVMVVGLGCEKLVPQRLLPPDAPESAVMTLQDERHRGFADMVAVIMEMAEKRLRALDRRRRETCPASALVVGLQCGGSDALSGVTANPAIGYAADLLVRAGATVMFSEVSEVRDGVHLLTPRAATPEVGRALIEQMTWYDDYLARGRSDRSANPTPGNKAGGLANIVEKSLGSIAKSGSSAIVDVLGPGERARRNGIVFAATPASDFVCGTLQLAAGCNVEVFSTGRGTPYGLAMAPVIKVSTRDELAERWPDLIDLSAGPIATGAMRIDEVGRALFHLILDVASGRTQTCADRLGIHNQMALFNPAPIT